MARPEKATSAGVPDEILERERIGHAKTELVTGAERPAITAPEKRPTVEKNKKLPRPFFEAGFQIEPSRAYAGIDSRDGTILLALGDPQIHDEKDVSATGAFADQTLKDRVHKIKPDESKSVEILSLQEVTRPRATASTNTLVGVFQSPLELEVKRLEALTLAGKEPAKERGTIPLVVAKTFREELESGAFFGIPLEEVGPENMPIIHLEKDWPEVKKIAAEIKERRLNLSDAEFTKKFRTFIKSKRYRELFQNQRLFLREWLKTMPLQPSEGGPLSSGEKLKVADIYHKFETSREKMTAEEYDRLTEEYPDSDDYGKLSGRVRASLYEWFKSRPDLKPNDSVLARFRVKELPQDPELMWEMIEPNLTPEEEKIVSELIRRMGSERSVSPEESAYVQQFVLLRKDARFHKLSMTGKFVLRERLRLRGLLPADPEPVRRLFERRRVTLATSAGKKIAILVRRDATGKIENLTDKIRGVPMEETFEFDDRTITARSLKPEFISIDDLEPEDVVVICENTDAGEPAAFQEPIESTVESTLGKRLASAEFLSKELAAKGLKTNITIKLKS